MKALEVFINGHRLCLAGVGEDGVLHAIVNWVGGPQREEEIFLSVGGLDCTTDEHLRWHTPAIGVGADILVRVCEAASVDAPDSQTRSERPSTLQNYRECLQQFAERLTEPERQQLLKELIADLEHNSGEPPVTPDGPSPSGS